MLGLAPTSCTHQTPSQHVGAWPLARDLFKSSPFPLNLLELTALLINLSGFGNSTFVVGSKKVKAVLPNALPHQAVGLRICFCQLSEHATNPSEPSH